MILFKPTVHGRKSRYWYAKLHDPKTKKWIKRALGVEDKQAARRIARDKQTELEQVAAGLVNPASKGSIADHLDDFMQHLGQQNRDETYRLQTEVEIIKVALACAGKPVPPRIDRKKMDTYRAMVKGVRIDDVTPDKVDDYLASLPDSLSARSRNGYRTSIVNLFNFLVKKRKLPFNPLLSVTRHKGEKKRKRRALLAAELQRLLDAAKVRPVERAQLINRGKRKGQNGAKLNETTRAKLERGGRQRSLIYATAFYTGLRRGELQAMRVKHLVLNGDVAYVQLPDTLTKNGKDAAIPIPQSLASLLRDWVAGRGPEDFVFTIPNFGRLVNALKKDLAFAGIPYRNEQGRVFDFHSLRKSLGTHLRLANVDPSVSMQFMRHGDIRLTMQTYNDEQLHNLAGVVPLLPVFQL